MGNVCQPVFISKHVNVRPAYQQNTHSMAEPLGVALLGAGLFARDAYLPLLRFASLHFFTYCSNNARPSFPALVADESNVTARPRRHSTDITVLAVWSRSSSAAEALLPTIHEHAHSFSVICLASSCAVGSALECINCNATNVSHSSPDMKQIVHGSSA